MSEEKKIIIDEDWKNQIAAEKEELQRGEETSDAPLQQEFPPASFEMLVTTFATEAMMALGQLPNPVSNESSFSPEHARYAIDMLQMLEEKTQGNLSPEEGNMLSSLLHQLRMLFVSLQEEKTPALEKKVKFEI